MCVVVLLAGCQKTPAVFSITVKDSYGNRVSSAEWQHNKTSVVFFLSPQCPLCQSYSLNIRQLQQQFENDSVKFYAIIPDSSFSNQTINEFKKTYSLSLPVWRDDRKQLTRLLGAKVTPEVFVLNEKATVLYSGRIDNWAYAVGQKRQVITQHELLDALTAVSQHKEITVKKTKAIGCFIE
ncbi:MAG: redoxin domain-containing protein [Bacteroidia bacterium]|nr:redoxin domain-containing protein [Bacteroidia bacterium]